MATQPSLGGAIGLQYNDQDIYTPIIAGNVARGEFARRQAEERKRVANQDRLNKIKERLKIDKVSNEYLDEVATKQAEYIDRMSKVQDNPIEVEKIAAEAERELLRAQNRSQALEANQKAIVSYLQDPQFEHSEAIRKLALATNDKERMKIIQENPDKDITYNPMTGQIGIVPKYRVDEVSILKGVSGVVNKTVKDTSYTDAKGEMHSSKKEYYENPQMAAELALKNNPNYLVNVQREWNAKPDEEKERIFKRVKEYGVTDPYVALVTDKFLTLNPIKEEKTDKDAPEKEVKEKLTSDYTVSPTEAVETSLGAVSQSGNKVFDQTVTAKKEWALKSPIPIQLNVSQAYNQVSGDTEKITGERQGKIQNIRELPYTIDGKGNLVIYSDETIAAHPKADIRWGKFASVIYKGKDEKGKVIETPMYVPYKNVEGALKKRNIVIEEGFVEENQAEPKSDNVLSTGEEFVVMVDSSGKKARVKASQVDIAKSKGYKISK